MNSDDSIQTASYTNSTLNNPTIDTSNELLCFEPSPTDVSQSIFQPITPPTLVVRCTSSLSHTDATSILSALSNHALDVPSPMTGHQLEPDLDDFNKSHQQIYITNNPLTIHQLPQSTLTSEST